MNIIVVQDGLKPPKITLFCVFRFIITFREMGTLWYMLQIFNA